MSKVVPMRYRSLSDREAAELIDGATIREVLPFPGEAKSWPPPAAGQVLFDPRGERQFERPRRRFVWLLIVAVAFGSAVGGFVWAAQNSPDCKFDMGQC